MGLIEELNESTFGQGKTINMLSILSIAMAGAPCEAKLVLNDE